jgi:hypothetical protein
MSYVYHDVTQLDGRDANIFIVISSVGIFIHQPCGENTSVLFHDPGICVTDVISLQLRQVFINVWRNNRKLLQYTEMCLTY